MPRIVAALHILLLLPALLWAQVPFTPLDTSFWHTDIRVAKPLQYNILFRKDDPVWLNDRMAPAKGKHDFMAYVPISGSTHGYLWVNHETTQDNAHLGAGGGATILEIQQIDGHWQQVRRARAVDFSGVGGTWNNCLGFATPWGTVLTDEEYEPSCNKDLLDAGMTDTSDIDGKPAYLNFGWMVEVDVETGRVLGKRKAMGRFSHEGNLLMKDEKTVYMLDDYAPGLFFKFVADKPRDFSAGQLYAYKQKQSGGSEWIPLPRDEQSLENIREVALRKGATFFLRVEDLELANDGFIYISETGKTNIDLSHAMEMGGVPAAHLRPYESHGVFQDTYGRILRFDPKTLRMQVFLQGGAGTDGKTHLANPDNLAYDASRNVLYIQEDLNEADRGRVPEAIEGTLINEIYALDLSIPAPSLSDLKRMLIGPPGCETTGACFTPDFQTMFVNIQHPSPSNPYPFDKDATIAITGFRR